MVDIDKVFLVFSVFAVNANIYCVCCEKNEVISYFSPIVTIFVVEMPIWYAIRKQYNLKQTRC